MITFHVLTLFPEIIEHAFRQSITGKAWEKGILQLNCVQIRDFAVNDYGSVDAALYGGGKGMLLRPEPIYDAFCALTTDWSLDRLERTPRFYLSPKGDIFNQRQAEALAQVEDIIFLCGHYEGVDCRVLDELAFRELSLGNFILTGGELAVAVILDAIARLVPGVLPSAEAYTQESLTNFLLEERQFTRPAIWRERSVPDVLLSGNQQKINEFRRKSSLSETLLKRPELLEKATLNTDDFLTLLECKDDD